MSDINELKRTEEQFPTHEEIQKRAHELYLARGGEHGQDIQDWLFAEDQLHREHRERVGTRTTTFVAGPGGVAKTNSASDEDLLIAEEERIQVRATEKLKEEGEVAVVPKAKTVRVGQRKTK